MDENNFERLLDKLARDLDLSIDPASDRGLKLENVFSQWARLPSDVLQRVALDLSLFAGSFGDWNLAYEVLQKLQELSTISGKLKIWELRCLVELSRASEALALSRSHHWAPDEQIHVNYLSGLAYESLGLSVEAAQRFDAVYRKNPHYSDVALRLVRE